MTHSCPPDKKDLVVILIKSSKYDSDGYLVQSLLAPLPSNTLAVMYSLTEAAFDLPILKDIKYQVEFHNEDTRLQRVNVRKIMSRHHNKKVIVGLVGVQTNMFPRATDLAYQFQTAGAAVVMGGFHITGSINMLLDGINPNIPCPHIMPPELQKLMDNGIILFHGEAEKLWPQVIKDIYNDNYKILYRGGLPDIYETPLPTYPPGFFKGFLVKLYTIETSRGACRFDCTFCSIINVQGKKARCHNPQKIIEFVESVCLYNNNSHFFFTDDNFARNPFWDEILIGLCDLQKQGHKFSIMIQSDMSSWRLTTEYNGKRIGITELFALAGGSNEFKGIESLNERTLKEIKKSHNQIEKYSNICSLKHRHGITCQASYIFGWPDDTPESIADDVKKLQEIGFDQAAFYILMPIPGSEDHVRHLSAGTEMDLDFNKYDSQRAVMNHPKMTKEELEQVFWLAWKQFYTVEYMVTSLKRLPLKNYWSIILNYLWYYWSSVCEKSHPMLCGIYRFRTYKDRRPSAPYVSLPKHIVNEIWRHLRYVGYLIKTFYIFQDVYFQTKWLPKLADKISGFELNVQVKKITDAVKKYECAWQLRIKKAGWFSKTFGFNAHRSWLNDFWRRYGKQKWKLLFKLWWHVRMLPHALTEVIYGIRFGWRLMRIITQI